MQHPAEADPQLIDVREFLGVLQRRRLTVAVVVLLVLGLAVFLVYRRPPVYTASARVEVRPLTAQSAQYGYFYDLQSSMDTEAQRVTSSKVSDLAAKLGAPSDASVGASVPANTTFLDVSCTAPNPDGAVECADAYAQAYVDDRNTQAKAIYDAAASELLARVAAIEESIESLTAELRIESDPDVVNAISDDIDAARRDFSTLQVQLSAIPAPSSSAGVLSLQASAPTEPSNKGYVSVAMLALILGGAIGIALAFLRERLDERVPDREGLERALGAPVFSVIPRIPGWRNRADTRLVAISAPDSAAAEAYRAARTMLLYLAREGGLKVVAITGPHQAEGKTTTTVNLAVSLAQAGKRVVAVSADLRKPRLHRFFQLDNSIGVTSVLSGQSDLASALARTDVPNLLILSSGPSVKNPAELLASEAMDDLLGELRQLADIVLVDTPPTLVVSDILGLLPKLDGVVVTVDASSTHRSAVVQLRNQLERAGGQIVGGLLNNVDQATKSGYGGYGYRDDYRDKSEARNGSASPATNGSGARNAASRIQGVKDAGSAIP